MCRLTDVANNLEHPDGLLIDEAAKQWLPHLYAAWADAWNRWKALGRGGSFAINHRGELINPEHYHPLLVAAVKADSALKDACRREFTTSAWSVSGLVGALRTRIDPDFLRDAQLNFLDRTAYSVGPKERTVVSALRVRRVADLRRDKAISTSSEAFGAEAAATREDVARDAAPWMDKQAPWKWRVWALCDAARAGTLPPICPATPSSLVDGDFSDRGDQAKCLRWICEVTKAQLDKNGKPPSAIEKGFRAYRETNGFWGPTASKAD